ncbi:response regulator [Herbaspirillum sp. SJZ107]|uniref:response regulator n=1 Tax=Herbaspirillum sp. SJZ107 TaxID=2572881 RepID=UPI001152A518|nr:response regulator [Herbaspirillum sp. SJZ107]TQK07406.1 histidine kinase [Herbaspirillum sp. SJZ107]
MTPGSLPEQRVLVLAPRGRDAEVIGEVLAQDGIACVAQPQLEALVTAMEEGAAAAIIAEEALDAQGIDRLAAILQQQAPWSDFPLVVLVSRPVGMAAAGVRARLAELGSIILLERPLNVQTLRSAALAALRGRGRQYAARDMLVERERAAEVLHASQEQLVQLNETLEARIDERTRALAQANDRLTNEIIERERALQTVNQLQKMEAIGQLTGGIAHDFNNLLNVVQGNMDLIVMMSPDEVARKRAVVARNACQRGAKLTSQLLAFSRNQSLDLRPVAVGTLFGGIRDLVATSVGSGIALQFEVDDDADGAIAVLADTNQIEMALLNLAINARDAMPGGGSLRFHARRAEPPPALLPAGDYVCIAVSDSGEGMSADVAARVFEPFFTTKGVGKGTGLGLSQVYGLAQQSGGGARILSTPGAGTTVEIWLRHAASGHDGQFAAGAVTRARRPGTRILLVEDDDVVRTSIAESLQALGHVVSQAANGTAALARLAGERPDLMITDYLMPGMTGAELMRKARAVHPDLPMIIATGYADMRAIESSIGGGILLRKPFQLADLEASIEQALERPA